MSAKTFQPMTAGYEIEVAHDDNLVTITIGDDHDQKGVIFDRNTLPFAVFAQAIAGDGYAVVPVAELARLYATETIAREYAESRRAWEGALEPATEGDVMPEDWAALCARQDAARAALLAAYARVEAGGTGGEGQER